MKKMLSLALAVCLSGCQKAEHKFDLTPQPVRAGYLPYRDLVPLPGLKIVPSERSLAYKDVDFGFIDQRIRSSLSMNDDKCSCKRFACVTTVLVDYGVIPAEKMIELVDSQIEKIQQIVDENEGKEEKKKKKKRPAGMKHYDGQDYEMQYKIKPSGYIITLNFYKNNQSPPAAPAFVGEAYTDELTTGTYEAFQFMIDEIIQEHVKRPDEKKIVVNLQYY